MKITTNLERFTIITFGGSPMLRITSASIALLLLAPVSLAGCDEEITGASTTGAATSDGSVHAPPEAKPGSHEDWCDEHAVPESLCTRCNPKLAAAFKVSGDWCEEHGLPESQCKACSPELEIQRPPKQ